MAFWVVIVPLPIAFLVPLRAGACLYLLLFGWAMIFAKIAFDLIDLISKFFVFVGNRVLNGTSNKVSVRVFRIIATLLVTLALAVFTQRENQRLQVPWLNVGAKTTDVIQTFRSLGLRPIPGSRILLLLKENPFQNKWNAFFIASLVWNDHSLRIWVETADELTPRQQANVDYIISLTEFQAQIIRAPDAQKTE